MVLISCLSSADSGLILKQGNHINQSILITLLLKGLGQSFITQIIYFFHFRYADSKELSFQLPQFSIFFPNILGIDPWIDMLD